MSHHRSYAYTGSCNDCFGFEYAHVAAIVNVLLVSIFCIPLQLFLAYDVYLPSAVRRSNRSVQVCIYTVNLGNVSVTVLGSVIYIKLRRSHDCFLTLSFDFFPLLFLPLLFIVRFRHPIDLFRGACAVKGNVQVAGHVKPAPFSRRDVTLGDVDGSLFHIKI